MTNTNTIRKMIEITIAIIVMPDFQNKLFSTCIGQCLLQYPHDPDPEMYVPFLSRFVGHQFPTDLLKGLAQPS